MKTSTHAMASHRRKETPKISTLSTHVLVYLVACTAMNWMGISALYAGGGNPYNPSGTNVFNTPAGPGVYNTNVAPGVVPRPNIAPGVSNSQNVVPGVSSTNSTPGVTK